MAPAKPAAAFDRLDLLTRARDERHRHELTLGERATLVGNRLSRRRDFADLGEGLLVRRGQPGVHDSAKTSRTIATGQAKVAGFGTTIVQKRYS